MIHDEARRGFQAGADAYERGRPSYPAGAIEWLSGELDLRPGRTLVDVGAGTGKLTRELVASGAEIVAVEPVPGMRDVLARAVPGARVLDGTAEVLPLPDESVDAITVAQAFHWFDTTSSLTEFHRVLRAGGRFALIWNRRRRDQPLHRAINEITEPYRGAAPRHESRDWGQAIAASRLFAPAGELTVPLEQSFDADGLVDRIASISFIAALEEPEHSVVLGRVRELAASWAEPLRLTYTTEAYVYERR